MDKTSIEYDSIIEWTYKSNEADTMVAYIKMDILQRYPIKMVKIFSPRGITFKLYYGLSLVHAISDYDDSFLQISMDVEANKLVKKIYRREYESHVMHLVMSGGYREHPEVTAYEETD